MPLHAQIRETGSYFGGHGFTACHFFLPEELAALFEGKNATVETLVGLEGLGSRVDKAVNRTARHPERWQRWLETHYRTCTHPAVVGTSEHMLIIARREEKSV